MPLCSAKEWQHHTAHLYIIIYLPFRVFDLYNRALPHAKLASCKGIACTEEEHSTIDYVTGRPYGYRCMFTLTVAYCFIVMSLAL